MGGVVWEWSEVSTRIPARRFEFHHIRPLVCQELRGIGTRHAAGEIKDAHTCKRAAHMTSFLLNTWTDTPHTAPLHGAVSIRLSKNAGATGKPRMALTGRHGGPPSGASDTRRAGSAYCLLLRRVSGRRVALPGSGVWRHGGTAAAGPQTDAFLYVNPGLGTLGLPLCLEMPPEITVLTL